MTYVKEMSGVQLHQHMARIMAIPGWNDPLSDRLIAEIHAQDAEIERIEDLNLKLSSACENESAEMEDLKQKLRGAYERAAKIAECWRCEVTYDAAPNVRERIERQNKVACEIAAAIRAENNAKGASAAPGKLSHCDQEIISAAWDLLLACEAELETHDPNDADDEPVGSGDGGPMAIKFGHMRRLRRAMLMAAPTATATDCKAE